ncbi:MAG: DUF58 domain-containing protein [Alphaproteobacteria bacterium]|nr:DUF58 domain-containing protein [Alphaproteobacteria bacterium]
MGLFSFNKEIKEKQYKGLCVSVEELIEQQKYLPYLSMQHNHITSNQAGDVKSVFKGRGMEFEEVREYIFGDDVRDIDWRVTARRQEPYTKIFNEEKDREITVLLDFSASMVFGTRKELKSVTAAKVAALIGWLTIRNKDRFGLLLFDGNKTTYFKPQNNFRNLMHVFNQIAVESRRILENAQNGDVSEALKILEYGQKGQGTLFILSDFYNFSAEKFKKIAALSKRQKIYCINIFDVIEELPPAAGVYAAQYGADKVVFDSGREDFQQNYRAHFIQQRNGLKKNCQKFLCKYIEIRTDVPIFKQLALI